MSQVNEASRLRPKFARAVITRAPVVDDRVVERRSIQLVLEKYAAVIRQRFVYDMHAFQISLERAPGMDLTGKVPAVAYPNGKRLRPENFTNLDALDVVFHGLPSHGRIRMSETPKLVRQL